jgi:hypothetical protein
MQSASNFQIASQGEGQPGSLDGLSGLALGEGVWIILDVAIQILADFCLLIFLHHDSSLFFWAFAFFGGLGQTCLRSFRKLQSSGPRLSRVFRDA